MKLGLIMLAAGNSRRFGSNKLLYTIEGEPMYRHILSELMRVRKALKEQKHTCEITVVTQYEEIAAEAEKCGAQVLYNLHPDEGISSSLKIGLSRNREMDACLFTVSDQPWLRGETILALLEVFLKEGKGIACVEYDGKLGNPCVFSERYYGELMGLEGEESGCAESEGCGCDEGGGWEGSNGCGCGGRTPVRYRLACGTWNLVVAARGFWL